MILSKKHTLFLWTPLALAIFTLVLTHYFYIDHAYPTLFYSKSELLILLSTFFSVYLLIANLQKSFISFIQKYSKTYFTKWMVSTRERISQNHIFQNNFLFYSFLFLTVLFIKLCYLRFDLTAVGLTFYEDFTKPMLRGQTQGLGFDDCPLFSYFLYLLHLIFQEITPKIIVLANAIMGSFSAVFVGKLVSHFSPNKFFISLVTLSLGLILTFVIWDIYGGYDAWFNFWNLWSFTLLFDYLKRPTRKNFIFFLIIFSMAILSKETLSFFLPLYLCCFAYSLRKINSFPWKKTLASIGIFLAVTFGVQSIKNAYNTDKYGITSNRRDYHFLINLLMYDYFKEPSDLGLTDPEDIKLARDIASTYYQETNFYQRQTHPIARVNFLGIFQSVATKFTQKQDEQWRYYQHIFPFLFKVFINNPFPYIFHSTAKFFMFTGSIAYEYRFLAGGERVFDVTEDIKLLESFHWFLEKCVFHFYWVYGIFILFFLLNIEEDKFLVMMGFFLGVFCISYGYFLGYSTMAEYYRLTVPCQYLAVPLFWLLVRYLFKAAIKATQQDSIDFKSFFGEFKNA